MIYEYFILFQHVCTLHRFHSCMVRMHSRAHCGQFNPMRHLRIAKTAWRNGQILKCACNFMMSGSWLLVHTEVRAGCRNGNCNHNIPYKLQGPGARLMASTGFLDFYGVLELNLVYIVEWVASLEPRENFFSSRLWSLFAFPSSFGVV
jgi:hypothetical protein